MRVKDLLPRCGGKDDEELDEKLEDVVGEDPDHLEGQLLLVVCATKEAEQFTTAKAPCETELSDHDEDVVEQAEKEEGDKWKDEGLCNGAYSPLGLLDSRNKTDNGEADGWKLEQSNCHNLK